MVLQDVDPSLAARQALHWYNAGDEVSVNAADSASRVSGALTQLQVPVVAGVVPRTLEPDCKLYLLCALSTDAAKRATRGAFQEVDGLLGCGVYCTTLLAGAQEPGLEVLVVRSLPGRPELEGIGIKVVESLDPAGQWRDEGFAGCWLPPGVCPVGDPKGELCLRASALTKATLQRPTSTFSDDRMAEVRRTMWILVGSHPHRLQRWRLYAQLISWPVLALTAAVALVSVVLARLEMYRAAAGAATIAAVFGLSVV
ncbi:unnamed protein product [Polarella glacialis]|uniref:Uncharacterized protein n=1 Tax=Polarella glacialis TaxID=89957 RepID=A0A813H230_POLGL|nr:unnamed protein product [Polarella glacialis]